MLLKLQFRYLEASSRKHKQDSKTQFQIKRTQKSKKYIDFIESTLFNYNWMISVSFYATVDRKVR